MFDFRHADILEKDTYRSGPLLITVIAADARHPWDGLETREGQTPDTHPHVFDQHKPWVHKILGYARTTSSSSSSSATTVKGPILASCEGYLVKRELLVPTRDEYGTLVGNAGRTGQILAQFCREFFDDRDRLVPQIKGKGFWGADGGEGAWVLVIPRLRVDAGDRRRGIGRRLVAAVLGHVLRQAKAEEEPGRAVLTVADPEVMREEADAAFKGGSDNGGVGFPDMMSFARDAQRVSRLFWTSLGFAPLDGHRVKWFGWRRSVADDLASAPPELARDRVDLDADLEALFGGEAGEKIKNMQASYAAEQALRGVLGR